MQGPQYLPMLFWGLLLIIIAILLLPPPTPNPILISKAPILQASEKLVMTSPSRASFRVPLRVVERVPQGFTSIGSRYVDTNRS